MAFTKATTVVERIASREVTVTPASLGSAPNRAGRSKSGLAMEVRCSALSRVNAGATAGSAVVSAERERNGKRNERPRESVEHFPMLSIATVAIRMNYLSERMINLTAMGGMSSIPVACCA